MAITYPLSVPASPAVSEIRWNPDSAVVRIPSPFTFETKQYVWPGKIRRFVASYPPMGFADAKAWQAWAYSMNGLEGTFSFKDSPIGQVLRGAGGGTPLVNGASQTGQTLNTDGWPVSTAILKAGDWLSIASRLFTQLVDVSSNGSGQAALTLWPKVATAYADNAALAVGPNAVGLFRLNQWSEQSWDRTRLMSGFTLNAEEAI